MVAENEKKEGMEGVIIHFPDLAKSEATVNPNLCLCLDVATHHTGYSLFENNRLLATPAFQLVGYGVFSASKKDDWQCRCLTLSSKIRNIIMTVKPYMLVLEYPSFQGGVKGTAASRSGGTLELAFLCGKLAMAWESYVAYVFERSKGKIRMPMPYLLTFGQWNGQLTKEITCRRLWEHFAVSADPHSIENNFADAIMMGEHFVNRILGRQVNGKHSAERVDL